MQKQKLSSCMTSRCAQAGKKLSGLLSDSCIPPHHLTPSVTGSICVETRPP